MSQSISAGVEMAQANSTMVQLMRLSHGWPQKRLAQEAGVSDSHVSRVEAGRMPLTGRPLRDYAQALECPTELLCVAYTQTPSEGTHFRSNASAAEWKRNRVLAQANVVAMRIGRMVQGADLNPAIALPTLDPDDYAAEFGEITVAQILRRFWRITGPVTNMTALLESAGVFVVSTVFTGTEVDAVTLRATGQHPHIVYLNRALPADRLRMTLAHELGHLVMDAMTLTSPAKVEARATTFAAEFLAPFDEIAHDLSRVSPRTIYELDELRMRWGVSVPSLVVRAHERGMLSDYHYRNMFRQLNESGRMYGDRPGVPHEVPRLAAHLLDHMEKAGYNTAELDQITLLSAQQRIELFGQRSQTQTTPPRRLTLV